MLTQDSLPVLHAYLSLPMAVICASLSGKLSHSQPLFEALTLTKLLVGIRVRKFSFLFQPVTRMLHKITHFIILVFVYSKCTCILQHHMLVHGAEESKPLQCDICYKRFLNNSALACHIKIHTGMLKFC